MDISIDAMTEADWPDVARIYREGIESGDATFEIEVPDWAAWDRARHPFCRLVARDPSGEVVGFACISPVSTRVVYAGVAEVMVYVAARHRGRGFGRLLLNALVRCSEDAGIWTLQAGIFPENAASLAIHHRMGFRTVGTRERLGRFRDGRWRDVVLLERRSARVGRETPPAP